MHFDRDCALVRANAVSERVADPTPRILVLQGLWAAAINRQGVVAARPLADQILALANRVELAPVKVWAHYAQLTTRYDAGDLAGAREHVERLLAVYDYDTAWIVPVDPGVSAVAYDALAAWLVGCPDTARRRMADASTWAARRGRAIDLVWAEYFAAILGVRMREPRAGNALEDRPAAVRGWVRDGVRRSPDCGGRRSATPACANAT